MATNRALQPTEFLTSRDCNLTYFGHFVHFDFNLLKKVARSLLLWGQMC